MARLPIIGPLPDYTSLDENSVPVDRQQIVEDNSQQVLGQGITKAANTLQDAVTENQQRQATQAKNLARSQANNAASLHELSAHAAVQDIGQQVQDGKLPYDQAAGAFEKAAAAIPVPKIANLDPAGAEDYNKIIQHNLLASRFAISAIAQQGQKQAGQDQLGIAINTIGKLNSLPGADTASLNARLDNTRALAINSGMPAPLVDKALQDAKDQNWLDNATQRSIEAKDNMPALKQLQQDLTSADGFYAGKLDTNKRNIVLRDVTNDQITLQNRIEHEQDKREAKAAGAVNQINEQISTGVPATPAMWSNWQNVTQGTAAEPEFKQALKDEQTVQDVLKQSPADQAKYVQDATNKLMTDGGSLRDRANVMRLQTAVKQNVTMMQNEPLMFAANRNGTGNPAPLDFTQLNTPDGQQSLGAQVTDRMNTLTALRKQYGGQIGLQPLLPQEAAQLSSTLENAAPKDRVGMLTALNSSVGNGDAYQAIMHQIAPHSPLTAIAGGMLATPTGGNSPWFDTKFATDPVVPTRILEGEQILHSKDEKGIASKFPMPPDKDLQAQFQSAVGGANSDLFRGRPDTLEAAYASYKAFYAAEANHQGVSNGVINTDIAQRAAQSVVGHVTSYQNTNLVVPSGMDPTKFEGAVNDASQSALKAGGYTDKDIAAFRGYGLRELGDTLGTGRYAIINGNGDALKSKNGTPISIDLNKVPSQHASVFLPQGNRDFAASGERATDLGDRR